MGVGNKAGPAELRSLIAEKARLTNALRESRSARERAVAELARARAQQERTNERLERLSQDREALGRRLTAIESSRLYRFLSRFWRLTNLLLPEGSRRQALYRRVRGRTPATVAAEVRAEPPVENEARDPERDMAAFEAIVRERQADTVVALLCTVQLVESEGQRATQLARELIRRGVPVIFGYWRWSSVEWCPQDRLDDGLLQLPVDVLVAHPDLLARCAGEASRRILILEWPYPGFVEVLAAANANGWETVYDVIDDWEEFHRVGQAIWYHEDVERHLLRNVDAVFAINRPLATRMRELGAGAVDINPNGLKPGIEAIDQPRPLPRGAVTVGYFGHLTASWFDWALVAAAAERRSDWRFYLIGYGGESDVPLPPNVELLGKQPQATLAAWAANWDVAIIPFKPDRLAAGADPIKSYEYLAMGLPVVATGVYPPLGAEAFVTRVEGVEAFVDAVAIAATASSPEAADARRAYAATTTWSHRLDAMLALLASGGQGGGHKRALLGPVHGSWGAQS